MYQALRDNNKSAKSSFNKKILKALQNYTKDDTLFKNEHVQLSRVKKLSKNIVSALDTRNLIEINTPLDYEVFDRK